MAASSNPLQRGTQGCDMFVHKNHAAGKENSSIMVGMFVFLCLTSQKPSEREFFVSAGTDLTVKLLILVVSHCLSICYFCPF
jgi:hypothetical protein